MTTKSQPDSYGLSLVRLQSSPRRTPANKTVLAYAVLTLISLLLMSQFGWGRVLLINGNYYPEVMFFFIAVILTGIEPDLSKRLKRVFLSKSALCWFYIIACLFVLGVMQHGDVLAAYADFRGVFLVGVAYQFSSRYPDTDTTESVVLYLLASSLAFTLCAYLVFGPPSVENGKYAIATTSYIGAIYLSLKNDKVVVSIISALVGSVLAVVSFYRSNLFFAVVLDLLVLVHLMGLVFFRRTKSGGSRVTAMAGLLSVAVFGGAAYDLVFQYFTSSSARFSQSIGKIILLYNQVANGGPQEGSAEIRAGYFDYLYDHLFSFLFPSGLGQKVVLGNYRSFWISESDGMHTGGSLDGGHLYLAAHFGIAVGGAVAVIILARAVFALASVGKSQALLRGIIISLTIICFMISCPFVQTGMAISFGLLAGLLTRPGIRRQNLTQRPIGAMLQAGS